MKQKKRVNEVAIPKQSEVSRELLVLVLIIIIFVSLLGTWTILSAFDKIPRPSFSEEGMQPSDHATVSLVILENDNLPGGAPDARE